MREEAHTIDKRHRSAISNGRLFNHDTDGRSARARRVKDLFNSIVASLGHAPNIVESSLIRTLASGLALLEEQQSAFAGGEEIDLDRYTRLAGAMARAARTLGLTCRGKAAGGVLADLGDVLTKGRHPLDDAYDEAERRRAEEAEDADDGRRRRRRR